MVFGRIIDLALNRNDTVRMTNLFDFSSSRRRFAVIGNPVEHSRSPEIHQIFGQQCGITLEYEAVQVDPGGLVQAIRNLQARGFSGLNVTVPYKQEVYGLADRLSARARVATAVNTVRFESDDIIVGYNTDGIGLLRDLEKNLSQLLRDARLLVVGAGGAVCGVLEPLLSARPATLVVTNRTAERAFSLASVFSPYGPIRALPFDQLYGQVFDVIINGTAASLTGERAALPDNLFATGALAYDMVYGDDRTPFLRWAQEQGADRVADGFGMLVEQAAASFELWHDVCPDTAPVLHSLRL
jgi:shikimate dehydrogenase